MKTRQKNLLLGILMGLMLSVNAIASSTHTLGLALKDLYYLFPLTFMPPAWAFMLSRGLIYLLGIVFFIVYCVHQKRQEKFGHWSQSFFPYYLSILLLNIFWIFATTQKWWIMSVVIISLMLINLYLIIQKVSVQTGMIKRLGEAARGIYMGWINVATIVLGISQSFYSLGYFQIQDSLIRVLFLSC